MLSRYFQAFSHPVLRCHINDLPPEILTFIFGMCRIRPRHGSSLIGQDDLPKTFDYRLSHVCELWRETAIACQEFWGVLPYIHHEDNHLLERLEIYLARCPSGPLDLTLLDALRWTSPECQSALHLVLPHLTRIRTLTVIIDIRPYARKVNHAERDLCINALSDALAAQPAPLLERVNLIYFASFKYGGSDVKLPRLPSTIFAQKPLSSLRRARLECCIVQPRSPFYSHSLRTLQLSNVRGWTNIDDMVECFQACPLLEAFTFVNEYEPDDDIEQPDGAPTFDARPSDKHPLRCVELNHLEFLMLHGTLTDNTVIFAYLAIPSTAVIRIENRVLDVFLNDRGEIGQEGSEMLALSSKALASHFDTPSNTDAHFLMVSVTDFEIEAFLTMPEINIANLVLGNSVPPAPSRSAHPSLPAVFIVRFTKFNQRAMPLQADLANHIHLTFESLPVLHCAEEVDFGKRLQWLLQLEILEMHRRSGFI